MPNWCYNYVDVTVNKDWYEQHKAMLESGHSGYEGFEIPPADKILEIFMNYVKTTTVTDIFKGTKRTNWFDFNKIIPQPQCIPQGISNWYPWNNNHWDTKWNSLETDLYDVELGENGKLSYKFDTAWMPPYSVFEQTVSLFPMLILSIDIEDEFCDDHELEHRVYKYGEPVNIK